MLDGNTSLQQIREKFQADFAPQRISLQDLQQFVGMLHRSGLVISHAGGQGRQLRRRADQKKKRELLGNLQTSLRSDFAASTQNVFSIGCFHGLVGCSQLGV